MDKVIAVAGTPLFATAIRRVDEGMDSVEDADSAVEAVWQAIRTMRSDVSIHRNHQGPLVITVHAAKMLGAGGQFWQVGVWKPLHRL